MACFAHVKSSVAMVLGLNDSCKAFLGRFSQAKRPLLRGNITSICRNFLHQLLSSESLLKFTHNALN